MSLTNWVSSLGKRLMALRWGREIIRVPNRSMESIRSRRSLNLKLFLMAAASIAAIGGIWGTQFVGFLSSPKNGKSDSKIVEASQDPESSRDHHEIYPFNERMSRAQVYWEQDDTAEAIAGLHPEVCLVPAIRNRTLGASGEAFAWPRRI